MGFDPVLGKLGLGDAAAPVYERIRARMHLHAVLPRLVELALLDDEARATAAKLGLRLEMSVLGGPRMVLIFDGGRVTATRDARSSLGLLFPTPGALNRMFDGGKVVPIPHGALWKLGQMKAFEQLTTTLTRYLKPSAADLADPAFRAKHVELSLLVGLSACDAIFALDPKVERIRGALHDATIQYDVGDQVSAHVRIDHGVITAHRGRVANPTAGIRIRDVDLAVELIAGRVDTFAAVGACDLVLYGMLPVVDEFNALFDRVGLYLK
jgi:hypothetical protein